MANNDLYGKFFFLISSRIFIVQVHVNTKLGILHVSLIRKGNSTSCFLYFKMIGYATLVNTEQPELCQ